ncbi:hypothetical protein ACFYOD_04890 [Streptomyces sp. NPDC006703]|uniref:hypothetical protein n=1 Tax=Streptomyces sp. NPDC006703 TaxID=3364759 RepID=UPI00369B2CF1
MRTYRLRRHALVACLALLVPLGFATACQNAAGGSAAEGKLANVSPSSSSSPASRSPSSSSASSPGSSPYAAAFLATGHCASREGAVGDTKDFHDVACTSERATARVLVRRDGTAAKGAAVACPLNTDFVLYVAESPPAAAEGGGGSVARGYACMRNLEAPHPGDPGAGGGPYTVVGDCVYDAGRELVKETACDGSGVNAPQFKVVSAVARRSDCPASTALYVQLTGGEGAVGCARRV